MYLTHCKGKETIVLCFLLKVKTQETKKGPYHFPRKSKVDVMN